MQNPALGEEEAQILIQDGQKSGTEGKPGGPGDPHTMCTNSLFAATGRLWLTDSLSFVLGPSVQEKHGGKGDKGKLMTKGNGTGIVRGSQMKLGECKFRS